MISKREFDANVDEIKQRIVSDFVGNTPFVKLSEKLYAKLESVNPGGSIKDRPVKWILDKSEQMGLINKNSTIVEATSGNTGISLAMMGAERGYKIKIVMPCDMSEERKTLLKMYGAELIEVDEGDFDGAIALKDKLVQDKGYFPLNQFSTPLNIECHYKTTFKEIVSHSLKIGKSITAFIAGTGTGGTLMGIQKGFSEYEPRVKIVAVEPLESPVMSGGEKGLHGIQGIGDGSKFLVDLKKVDEIITISTEDAKIRAKELCKNNGLFVGISAGANVLASERWIEKNNPDGIIFTILCDRGERYCSVL
ncbi:MAG: cysteine synthase A [Candidatus Marinimicrobia bacterium]|nr:cysteine synthase A [Candidatus Neomarinimicrobiota bacterium]|tara:strand:- start:2611 stop:3534 length:924 start_codon:yes stop_codon:yes gene_type:complete